MVEGQGPVTPGNRRKRIGANSPAYLRKMRLYIKTPVIQGFFQFEDLSLMLYLQLLKIFIEKVRDLRYNIHVCVNLVRSRLRHREKR